MRAAGGESGKGRPRRRSRYDYLLEYVDSGRILLRAGQDYTASFESARHYLRAWTKERGLRIETRACWFDPGIDDPPASRPREPYGMWLIVRRAER
jgi:hypothetical protein